MNFSKKRISYFYDSDIGNFNYGGDHPMKPRRIRLTDDLITGYGLHKKMKVYSINKSTTSELTNYHSKEYIEFLQFITPDNQDLFDGLLQTYNVGEDSPVFDGLFKFCQISAGGSIDGARKLNNGETDIAINWSGGLHHAKKREASGFCYVNDIVLGILELLKYHPRVLYIDIDIHHGDGVEEAFQKTNRVMTCSFHKYGSGYFPGTGNIKDIGVGEGENYSVNFPLDDGIDDESYLNIFKKTIDAIMKYYQPSAIVLQCGADTLAGDELGCFNLTLKGHGACVKYVKKLGKPLLVLGGGGYTPKNVAKCWAYETSLLIGETDLPNELPETDYSLDFPDEKFLHIEPNLMKNSNESKTLEKSYLQILENLKQIESVPSVSIRTVPYDGVDFGINYTSYEKYKDNEDSFEVSEEEDYLETLWNEDERDFGIDYNLEFLDQTFEEITTLSFLKNDLNNNFNDPFITKLNKNQLFKNFEDEKKNEIKFENDQKHSGFNIDHKFNPNINNLFENSNTKNENLILKLNQNIIGNTKLILSPNSNKNTYEINEAHNEDEDEDKDGNNSIKQEINKCGVEYDDDENHFKNSFQIISDNKEKRIQKNFKNEKLISMNDEISEKNIEDKEFQTSQILNNFDKNNSSLLNLDFSNHK
ncbi:histone deacetylase rpd3 [Anaeramoeba flamelloides]|uniref:histone deacetylase n=1 Tax=Anaeramoeba flamelloides TaxID=1746091 RepID=A0ABQ8XRB8_9EUKA|nr:histone deacetylase rpd3 [Anaeramoeba flamelloides]